MNGVGRVELVGIGISTGGSAAIAAIADPLPPLLHVVESRAWTRGIEFVILLLVSWMLLSVVGVIRAKIGLKLDGVTAERLLVDGDSQVDYVTALRHELSAIHIELDRLMVRLEALPLSESADLEGRIEALEAITKVRPVPEGASDVGESGEPHGA
jgi:hypothetical protein